MSASVDIRHLLANEVDRYRQLRLRSLFDSPTAFTATWEQESTMPKSDWRERVESSVAGQSAIVVADTGDELVGVATGISWGRRARVVGVWVAPDWRGRGLAQRLIDQVCKWAAAAGYSEVQIETAIGNAGPQRLYERLGFVPRDDLPPPECGPVLVRRV